MRMKWWKQVQDWLISLEAELIELKRDVWFANVHAFSL